MVAKEKGTRARSVPWIVCELDSAREKKIPAVKKTRDKPNKVKMEECQEDSQG